jgi:hypothetical protein
MISSGIPTSGRVAYNFGKASVLPIRSKLLLKNLPIKSFPLLGGRSRLFFVLTTAESRPAPETILVIHMFLVNEILGKNHPFSLRYGNDTSSEITYRYFLF